MFAKMALKLGKKYLFSQVNSDAFRKTLGRSINREIDIPGLDEKQEAALIDALLKALMNLLS